MILTGTIANVATICAGALIGRYAGRFVPARTRRTVMAGLGLTVLLIVAIALDMMELKRIPVGNLLPSVFVVVGLAWAFGLA